jgi:hypothetical protein
MLWLGGVANRVAIGIALTIAHGYELCGIARLQYGGDDLCGDCVANCSRQRVLVAQVEHARVGSGLQQHAHLVVSSK